MDFGVIDILHRPVQDKRKVTDHSSKKRAYYWQRLVIRQAQRWVVFICSEKWRPFLQIWESLPHIRACRYTSGYRGNRSGIIGVGLPGWLWDWGLILNLQWCRYRFRLYGDPLCAGQSGETAGFSVRPLRGPLDSLTSRFVSLLRLVFAHAAFANFVVLHVSSTNVTSTTDRDVREASLRCCEGACAQRRRFCLLFPRKK